MLAGVMEHAQWIAFGLILANQAGVPVFAAPAMLGVGALVWTGELNIALALATAVGASLCADLAWYSVTRWRGPWALAALKRQIVLTRQLGPSATKSASIRSIRRESPSWT